jgi:hypothetical protein
MTATASAMSSSSSECPHIARMTLPGWRISAIGIGFAQVGTAIFPDCDSVTRYIRNGLQAKKLLVAVNAELLQSVA